MYTKVNRQHILVLLYLITATRSCLPNPFLFSPGYGGFYAPPMPLGGFPRIGPWRSEAQHGPSISGAASVFQNPVEPRFSTQFDEISSVSALNCANFGDKCRWANTQEEELDWSTVQENPQSDVYLATIGVQNSPDQLAGALISEQRKGWEGGQLVSDPLPCVNNGLKVTATAWSSRYGTQHEQPKLQVCAKNTNEEKFPLVNCNEFEIRNGVPISVDVPLPNRPKEATQIVFYGNNFVANEGGAIFLQDIVLEGALRCNGEEPENSPTFMTNENTQQLNGNPAPIKMPFDVADGLEAINAMPSSNIDDHNSLTALHESIHANSVIHPVSAQSLRPFDDQQFPLSPQTGVATVIEQNALQASDSLVPNVPSLFETCLALSCNPSDLNCKFWRSAGNNRWEIGVAGRVANPLTGIHLPPGTAQKFLVAPFFDSHISSYTLVSEPVNISLLEEVFFCFYEYFATDGLSLSICTDKMDCFYKKTTLSVGNDITENKKWNIRCTKMPSGQYEMRVIAENTSDNKGEIGFLPIRLSRDAQGQQLIC